VPTTAVEATGTSRQALLETLQRGSTGDAATQSRSFGFANMCISRDEQWFSVCLLTFSLHRLIHPATHPTVLPVGFLSHLLM
jgi:hypothetical protein